MKLFWAVLMTYACIGFSSPAWAGKMAQLRKAVASSCPGRTLNRRELVQLTRKAFLTCRPRTRVAVDKECSIDCLKENLGNVIATKQAEGSSDDQ